MAKKIKNNSPEDIAKRVKEALQRELEQLEKSLPYLFYDYPTRYVQIGERVRWGSHTEVYVEDILHNGLIYLLRSHYHQDPQSQKTNIPDGTPSHSYQLWTNVFPYKDVKENLRSLPEFSVNDDIVLQFYQQEIDSLLHLHYYGGINYDADYQRDYVWDLADKVALIDSIMNNVDIGKFTFVRLSHAEGRANNGKYYEVLDGKQRLRAIIEFYEDRFLYKGKMFSELRFRDRYAFEGHAVVKGELPENSTREQKLRTFVKLNTSGKVMDKDHLERIRQEWLVELKKSQIEFGIKALNEFKNDEDGNINKNEGDK